jgi:hypothetical protein
MKKCPTCSKTFEDSMRFCQTDGTPLIDDEPAFDPYATIVAPKADIMAQMEAEAAAEASSDSTSGPEPANEDPAPIAEPDDVLDLPTPDPLKTMFASDAELQEVLAAHDEPEGNVLDVPDSRTSEPFAGEEGSEAVATPFAAPEPPPSPFAESEEHAFSPEPQFYDEAATMMQSGAVNPFDVPSAPADQWSPQPTPQPTWQDQGAAMEGSFQQSAPVTGGGQNQTLAVVSLITGIVGLFFCGGLVSPVALVTGFMARKRARENPQEYGGDTLALIGMIMGIVGSIVLLAIVAYLVFVFLIVGASIMAG